MTRIKIRRFVAWMGGGVVQRYLISLGANLAFGAWLRTNDLGRRFASRDEMYVFLNGETFGSSPIDYLEFGVYKGESIRRWADLNQHPESRFYGFDTFEGLPEPWTGSAGTVAKGTFSIGGELPEVPDNRVVFIKGMFQDTLEPFLSNFESRGRLVIHCDADLYSATLYVLCTMNRLVTSGTVIMFDEFYPKDEFRAFRDYVDSFRKPCKVIAHVAEFCHNAAVEIL